MTAENIIIGDPIYIVGHKKPDLDSIVAAYAYQVYRHARGDFNYIALRCGEVSPVTEWVFDETGFSLPKMVKSIEGMKIVLVDHTDPEQRADGWEDADIVEVVDHHKLKLETSAPAKITVRPYGSTTTMIADKLIKHEVFISPQFAQLMLSAIIDDTLALRSPITTYVDKTIAGKLAAMSGLGDIDAYAKKMFSTKDSWHTMTPEKIVETDIKDFEFGKVKSMVSQVETLDATKLLSMFSDIQKYLEEKVVNDSLDLAVVLVTDILKSEAHVLAAGKEKAVLETVFNLKFKDNVMLIDGMQSRKKDFIPPLTDYYKKK